MVGLCALAGLVTLVSFLIATTSSPPPLHFWVRVDDGSTWASPTGDRVRGWRVEAVPEERTAWVTPAPGLGERVLASVGIPNSGDLRFLACEVRGTSRVRPEFVILDGPQDRIRSLVSIDSKLVGKWSQSDDEVGFDLKADGRETGGYDVGGSWWGVYGDLLLVFKRGGFSSDFLYALTLSADRQSARDADGQVWTLRRSR